jgi:4-hydroxybenzoate polyprenyltransferase
VVKSFFLRLFHVLEMIKFHHTIFALPFALLSLLWASDGRPGWRVTLWVLAAMVGARSAAMTFNRLVDLKQDRLNPRTRRWALSTGAVSLPSAWVFFAFSVALFEVAAWALNPLCLALSPAALVLILGYSYTKRFTPLCHLVLGFADGISAPGAWIAFTGSLRGSAPAWWLCAALTAWIGGFDLLYALQDREFDMKMGLHSWPARFGVKSTLWASGLLHLCMVGFLAAAAAAAGTGALFWVAIVFAAAALTYEHAIVRPSDLSRLNAAFFTVNGYLSLGILALGVADLLIKGTS